MTRNLSIQNDHAFLTHFLHVQKKTFVFSLRWVFLSARMPIFFCYIKKNIFPNGWVFSLHPSNALTTCIEVECHSYLCLRAFYLLVCLHRRKNPDGVLQASGTWPSGNGRGTLGISAADRSSRTPPRTRTPERGLRGRTPERSDRHDSRDHSDGRRSRDRTPEHNSRRDRRGRTPERSPPAAPRDPQDRNRVDDRKHQD